jgi:hypothetical protein
MRHHMDVGLVEVPPDPSMVGSDVKGELPSTHLHLPASQPPVVNLAAPRERDWAVEVGEVEPVRDDSLERRVSLADHSPVRPSIVPASLHAGHRGIAAWPSQHQRDRVARNPNDRSVLDPPHDPEVRYARQLHYPRSVEWDQPSNRRVMQHDRLSWLVEGVQGESGETASPARGCVLMALS